ncbi:MAG: NADP-dependent oxidoreductase [Microcoleus sp. SIO2G3]|nr:NADP-dependent oxidoreductase [Microcoleus sp. SIO2G3]
MKAVRIHSYGGAEVLTYEDAPQPNMTVDDVLVRVYAAAINGIDWKIRQGYFQQRLPHQLPLILGWDVSGVVEAVGANVTNFQVGDPVYGMADFVRDGAFAEYIAVRAAIVTAKPESLDYVQAASVPIAALTAWQSLFEAGGLSEGQRVLIHGAAGSVGVFAVQFAKRKGAYVIGTASADDKHFLSELGVDEFIDYQTSQFEDVVHNVDVVLDSIGGEVQQSSWKVLRQGGILISIVSPPSPETAAAYNVRGMMFSVKPNAAQLTEIGKLLDAGQLKLRVGAVLPLAEARQGHELIQKSHKNGKIVLQVVS